ncbi:ribonuclease P/MRP protein subunit POP5 [Chrysoperla carnea]|uniref:ribonuclease P/MRP protein subunit POP5 n=1 Tax=Chrysoperla carnea TaxID=189513 RepID=UPI001D06D773|nr:ribonuclease P/MRP protein subunit POP5 [Chrysoperla carnea]
MVRFKNRYVTVEITPVEKHSAKIFELKPNGLYNAIIAKVQQLHGDFGVAAIKAGFVAKYCNKLTRIALVKVRHGPHRFVTSSLPFITSIDTKAVTIRTLYTGATIKQCFKFIIGYQKTKLIETLRTFKTNEEKENFRKAIMDLETIAKVT